jgi:hypothetical protein
MESSIIMGQNILSFARHIMSELLWPSRQSFSFWSLWGLEATHSQNCQICCRCDVPYLTGLLVTLVCSRLGRMEMVFILSWIIFLVCFGRVFLSFLWFAFKYSVLSRYVLLKLMVSFSCGITLEIGNSKGRYGDGNWMSLQCLLLSQETWIVEYHKWSLWYDNRLYSYNSRTIM